MKTKIILSFRGGLEGGEDTLHEFTVTEFNIHYDDELYIMKFLTDNCAYIELPLSKVFDIKLREICEE